MDKVLQLTTSGAAALQDVCPTGACARRRCVCAVACRLRASNSSIWGGRHRCANGMAGSSRLLADRWSGRRGVPGGATVERRGGSQRRGERQRERGEGEATVGWGSARSGNWHRPSFPHSLHQLGSPFHFSFHFLCPRSSWLTPRWDSYCRFYNLFGLTKWVSKVFW